MRDKRKKDFGRCRGEFLRGVVAAVVGGSLGRLEDAARGAAPSRRVGGQGGGGRGRRHCGWSVGIRDWLAVTHAGKKKGKRFRELVFLTSVDGIPEKRHSEPCPTIFPMCELHLARRVFREAFV